MHRFLDLLGAGSDDAPGVVHLPELVDGVRRNGLAVDLAVEPVDLPPSLSTAVYRVVQEALTNVVRHSDAGAVRVEVHRDDHALVARVTDDGRAVATRVDGSGRGLTGLRERLALYDGTLESGATGDGWRVEARIPLGATG
jgi:signal transduction histidine kinase